MSLKSDCSLVSSLYISCQRHNGDLDEFFSHENQACPPSLSSLGKLRLGTKSDNVNCLESLITMTDAVDNPTVDAVILDGAVIVNMLKPGTANTFSDYASEVFLPYVTKQLQGVRRLDVVWDEVQASLKAYTCFTRGKGSRRCVESSNAVPKNWMEFLRNEKVKDSYQFGQTIPPHIILKNRARFYG